MNATAMSRIAADSRPVLVFTVILTVAVALASFALSFAALRDAALWGRVPEPLAFLVPVVIDASVLVYGLVALVLKARGRSAVWAWTLMLFFTVVSIGANAAHAYDVPETVKVIVGVVLVALAPLSVLTSTHALASLVIADEPAPAVVEPATVDVAADVTGPASVAMPATAAGDLASVTPRPATSATAATAAAGVEDSAVVPVLAPVRSGVAGMRGRLAEVNA